MQTEAGVEDIVNTVERIRILCVGRAGVGKSSLINRVFRLGAWEGSIVEESRTGEADIEKEFTSPENKHFVLHDSKGFEAGNQNTFNAVDDFIRRRRMENLPLKEQLHVVWLCTEFPTAGGRPFETGDENLLQLAHETQTPIVVVFTKFDKGFESKRLELQEENENLVGEDLDHRSKEEVKKVLDACVQSLKYAVSRMEIPEPRHVPVSDRPYYEDTIESLVTVTGNLLRHERLRVLWFAQVGSLRAKTEGCVDNAFRGITSGIGLHDCLARVHQNIIAFWNFEEEKILSDDPFKRSMLCLSQGVQEPPNRDGSHTKADTASASPVAAIGLTPHFEEWLSNAVLNDDPSAQRVLMSYTADLITVLKLLFENVTRTSPSGPPRTIRPVLYEVYQAYRLSDTRRQIYLRISESFQQDRQIPGRDEDIFRCLMYEFLGYGPVSPPLGQVAASSSVGSGVASSSHPTRKATSSPPIEVAASSQHTTQMPSSSPERIGVVTITRKYRSALRAAPPQSTSPPFWRYHRP